MLVRVRSSSLLGVSAVPVDVEVDVAGGMPRFLLVGLAGARSRSRWSAWPLRCATWG